MHRRGVHPTKESQRPLPGALDRPRKGHPTCFSSLSFAVPVSPVPNTTPATSTPAGAPDRVLRRIPRARLGLGTVLAVLAIAGLSIGSVLTRRPAVPRRRGRRAGMVLNAPIVSAASTPTATATGRAAPTAASSPSAMPGSTARRGSLGQAHRRHRGTPDGRGYWEVASDGGVFAFGDARFHGSTGSLVLSRPIVGIDPTPDDGGYWMVASDGGVFAFGDASFYGSASRLSPDSPIVGMASTPDGHGYWEAAADGAVFAFGDARFAGGRRPAAGGGHQRRGARLSAGHQRRGRLRLRRGRLHGLHRRRRPQ